MITLKFFSDNIESATRYLTLGKYLHTCTEISVVTVTYPEIITEMGFDDLREALSGPEHESPVLLQTLLLNQHLQLTQQQQEVPVQVYIHVLMVLALCQLYTGCLTLLCERFHLHYELGVSCNAQVIS